MADGIFVSGLNSAPTLVPANDFLYIVCPASSPKSRKITAQTLMAGPTAAAAAAQGTADTAVSAVATEASTRATFDAQFSTELSLNHGAAAVGAGSAGSDIISDGGANTEIRLARLGPKVWHILVRMRFDAATAVATDSPVRWALNVPEINTPGSLFETFFAALPNLAGGPIAFAEVAGPFGQGGYSSNLRSAMPLGIYKGSGASSLDAFSIAAFATPGGDAATWGSTSDALTVRTLLSRTIQGTIILP